ncbi:hypothetical protein GCM10012280_39470 [Wenjunlia tyrosinilytica]|uniref:Transmembrane protein n=2 Tax=Wenjunlia tyrosinilytica TaxID=1544741 RepID=A0A918E011_9ACTN|nr:hypothetical protein [Wenjunlia tyrosinilytica]GGO91481.1 hypothetical protein GCM10012280_39470 [Wenjunlia tyrosinilytica]
MEAGPRDRPHDGEPGPCAIEPSRDSSPLETGLDPVLEPVLEPVLDEPVPDPVLEPGLEPVLEPGPYAGPGADPLSADGPLDDVPGPDEHELRPQRRLRIWQLAPIVALGVLGSLMFAFPLAFEFGDGGAVVAMLGLLTSAATAGWGIMAGRRVGHVWPGLPVRGSGDRPDWRYIVGYALLSVLIGVLAIWRVARLR